MTGEGVERINIRLPQSYSHNAIVAGVSATPQDRFSSALRAGHETHTGEQRIELQRMSQPHYIIGNVLYHFCLKCTQSKSP